MYTFCLDHFVDDSFVSSSSKRESWHWENVYFRHNGLSVTVLYRSLVGETKLVTEKISPSCMDILSVTFSCFSLEEETMLSLRKRLLFSGDFVGDGFMSPSGGRDKAVTEKTSTYCMDILSTIVWWHPLMWETNLLLRKRLLIIWTYWERQSC